MSVSSRPSDIHQKLKDDDDLRLLASVGAHFQLNPKHGSWPKSLELTDDEGASQDDSAPKPKKSLIRTRPSHKERRSGDTTQAPNLTRTERAAYLPHSEFKELERQRSSKQKHESRDGHTTDASSASTRMPSPSTTIDRGTDDEFAPEHNMRAHTAFSTTHTPSHHSFGTIDEESRGIGKEPCSPRPWSAYDQKYNKADDSFKE